MPKLIESNKEVLVNIILRKDDIEKELKKENSTLRDNYRISVEIRNELYKRINILENVITTLTIILIVSVVINLFLTYFLF